MHLLIEVVFNYVFHVVVTTVKSMSSTGRPILCEFISIDNYEGFRSTKCVGESSFVLTEFISHQNTEEQSRLQRPYAVRSNTNKSFVVAVCLVTEIVVKRMHFATEDHHS